MCTLYLPFIAKRLNVNSLTLNLHKFTINSISRIKPFALVSHSEAQFVSEMGRSIIVVCTQPLQLIFLVFELE